MLPHKHASNYNVILFTTVADPGRPQMERGALQREDTTGTCVLTLRWNPPSNIIVTDVMYYMIHINGTHFTNVTSTSTAFPVPTCAAHLIRISAINHCGRVGPSTLELNIHPYMDLDNGRLTIFPGML